MNVLEMVNCYGPDVGVKLTLRRNWLWGPGVLVPKPPIITITQAVVPEEEEGQIMMKQLRLREGSMMLEKLMLGLVVLYFMLLWEGNYLLVKGLVLLSDRRKMVVRNLVRRGLEGTEFLGMGGGVAVCWRGDSG
jgi:hypothetical protein